MKSLYYYYSTIIPVTMYSTLTNIIIPMSSDCHMSDPSDPFAAADPIPNSFPLLPTENEFSQEGNLEQLELSVRSTAVGEVGTI
jgi:hypothetical protein